MKPYYQDNHATIYHGDCAEILPWLESVKIDLILTDPPYGIGAASDNHGGKSGNGVANKRDYGDLDWDDKPIDQEFITYLTNYTAIIFGGNYYAVPPSACWLIWDKDNGSTKFADCELAWTNLPGAVRMIKHMWNGMLRQNKDQRWHPTQKPIDVMQWCILQADTKLKNQVQTIVDPFMGVGTTLRAAKNLNRQSIGIELEEKYCEIAAKRLKQEVLNF